MSSLTFHAGPAALARIRDHGLQAADIGIVPAAAGGPKGLIFQALDQAQQRASERERSDNLQSALGSREIIGQAQGILMEREKITAEQAFNLLRQSSQHLNRKLRDVAQDLVDTGETPDLQPPAPTAHG